MKKLEKEQQKIFYQAENAPQLYKGQPRLCN
jgi:hypothetical protein